MKLIKALVAALCGVVALGSCDNRDDLYLEQVQASQIVVEVNGKKDTTFAYYKNYHVKLGYDFHVTNERIFDSYKDGWLYFDTLNVKLSTIVEGKEYPLKITVPHLEREYEALLYKLTEVEKSQTIVRTVNSSDDYYEDNRSVSCSLLSSDLSFFDNDTSYTRLGSMVCSFTYQQLYGEQYPGEFEGKEDTGEEFEVWVYFTLWGPCPPTPILEVIDIEGNPMEKRFSLAKSKDQDGEVLKYEYCIDGNIVNYKAKENRFDFIEGPWQSGKAAYGGTYITATEKSDLNFEFQKEGEHIVYYRCMDNFRVWSTWKRATIKVGE